MINTACVAKAWMLRTRELQFDKFPKLMGILNVTPDSFSDGGKYFSTQLAIDQALRLEDEGADIIDIGGESTRPYSSPVDADEEQRRVIPVIEALIDRVTVPISIDTTKSAVAKSAIEAGAEILNDVSGLEADPDMLGIALSSGVGVCAMHMQGTPQTMQDDPRYKNVIEDIFEYLVQRKAFLVSAGMQLNRICLDPGIGFGKTHEHNIELVRGVKRFHELACPILVGHSRKGFIGKLVGPKAKDRSAGSVGVSLALAKSQVQVLRIHDVAATREALACFIACGGDEQ